MTQLINQQAIIRGRIAEGCRSSFARFFYEAWAELEPTVPLAYNWHIKTVCDHIQASFDGWRGIRPQQLQNLLISLPPGTTKSRIVSVCALPWIWLHEPSFKSFHFAHSLDLVYRDALLMRRLVTSEWYRTTFNPTWELSEDQNAKGCFTNTAGGERRSMTVGSSPTGLRADALVVDDPIDARNAFSAAEREAVKSWWMDAARSRVNSVQRSLRWGIAQRTHMDDWSALVLSQGWEHLCIPMRFVPAKYSPTAIGWVDPRKVEGEPLHPARFSDEWCAKEQREIKELRWTSQYQQDPTSVEGNLFKREWISYFEEQGEAYVLHDRVRGIRYIPKHTCKRATYCDFALTAKTSSDFTVIGTFDFAPSGEVILVNLLRRKLEDPDIEPLLLDVYSTMKPVYLAIEDRVNGTTMLQRLRRTGVRTKPLKADRDKVSRCMPASIDMQNGRVYFPKSAEFLADIEAELLAFPVSKHDDFVDVLSYACADRQNLTMSAGLLTEQLYDACVIPGFTIPKDNYLIDVAKCGPLFMGIGVGPEATTVWIIEQGIDSKEPNPKLKRTYRTVLVKTMKNIAFQDQFNCISSLMNSRVRNVLVDTNGIGAGMYELMDQHFRGRCNRWNPSAGDKAEAIERVAVWVAQNRLGLPPDPDLRTDLLSMRRITLDNGKADYEGQTVSSHCDGYMGAAIALEAAEGEQQQFFNFSKVTLNG